VSIARLSVSLIKYNCFHDVQVYNWRVNPFFSVCVDATDRHSTILTCLESILAQDFKDFEVLICDSSSDSSCLDLIMGWLSYAGDSRFKVYKTFHEPGESEIKNWNRPIDRAQGQFIAMLEGDDFLHTRHLSGAFNLLSETPGVSLYFSRGTSDEGFSLVSDIEFNYVPHDSGKLLIDLLQFNWCPVPSVTIFPRIVNGAAVRYDEKAKWAAEYFLYYNLLHLPVPKIFELAQVTVFRSPSHGTRNSFHLSDAEDFLNEHQSELRPNQLHESQNKIKVWAIGYLYQNAALGQFDSGSLRIVKKYSNKVEYYCILLRFVLKLGRSVIS